MIDSGAKNNEGCRHTLTVFRNFAKNGGGILQKNKTAQI